MKINQHSPDFIEGYDMTKQWIKEDRRNTLVYRLVSIAYMAGLLWLVSVGVRP